MGSPMRMAAASTAAIRCKNFIAPRGVYRKAESMEDLQPSTGPKLINWIPALVLTCVSTGLAIAVDLLVLLRLNSLSLSLALVTLPVVLVTLAFWANLHYHCWRALPPRFRATSPRRAVLLLFVPLFNFYWGFVSYGGLARGYVQLRQTTGLPNIRNRVGLGITLAILLILGLTIGFVPGLCSLVAIAHLVIFILYYRAIAKSANRVMQSAAIISDAESAML
jgi:hypothetical protein